MQYFCSTHSEAQNLLGSLSPAAEKLKNQMLTVLAEWWLVVFTTLGVTTVAVRVTSFLEGLILGHRLFKGQRVVIFCKQPQQTH